MALCRRRPGRSLPTHPLPTHPLPTNNSRQITPFCSWSQQPTIHPGAGQVATLPVLPLVAVSSALAAACGYIFRAPIFSKALTIWLGARVSVSSVGYEPLRGGRWTFGRTRVVDHRGRPLCSFQRASISAKLKAAEGGTGLRRQKHYVVELDRPEVAACFDDFDISSSNWSEWASRFRSSSTLKAADEDDSDKEGLNPASEATTQPLKSPRVQLNINDGLLLSLRYSGALAGKNNHIINDVLLTDLDGVGDDLLSPTSTARLVERLAARAIQSASHFRFENSKVRSAARSYARRTMRSETRSMRAVARIHVRRLRKNIAFADEFLSSLPDTQRFTDAAKTGDTVLSQLESWLKMLDKSRPDSGVDSDADADADEESREQEQAAVKELPPAPDGSQVGQRALAPSPPPAPKYLELDEEWVGSSDSSDPKQPQEP